MPNKFQKSVLERREQTAVSQSIAPAAVPEPEPRPQPQAEPATGEAPQATALPGIDSFLRPESRRKAGSKTFYLDAEVVTALGAAARKRGIAESRLVNDILRGVLGL